MARGVSSATSIIAILTLLTVVASSLAVAEAPQNSILHSVHALRLSDAYLLSAMPTHQLANSNSFSSRGQVLHESVTGQTTSVKWTNLTSGLAYSPPANSGMQTAYDAADGYLMLYGGYDAVGSLDTTWQFTNTSWVQVTTSGSPPGTNLGGMAYDGADGYVVLFGGNQNGISSTGQTSTYLAGTWTEIAPSPAPGGRAAPAMVYDTADGYVLLFGGCAPAGSSVCSQSRNDSWEFKAGAWTQLTPLISPPARTDAAIAYDPALGAAVMFGGCVQVSGMCSSVLNDTWEFHAGVWTQIHTSSSPPARSGAAMTFDPNLGCPVLFGGSTLSGSALSDTWEFTGTNWVQLNPGPSPLGRWRFSLAYDPAYQEVVLFGGNYPGGWLGDTWALTVSTEQPTIAEVSISPGSSGLASGATQSFSAKAATTNGSSLNSGVSYSWSFSPSSLGILNATKGSSVTFTAGSVKENGTLFVNATYQGVSREGASSISATGSPSSSPTQSSLSALELALIAVVAILAAALVAAVLYRRRRWGGGGQMAQAGSPPPPPATP